MGTGASVPRVNGVFPDAAQEPPQTVNQQDLKAFLRGAGLAEEDAVQMIDNFSRSEAAGTEATPVSSQDIVGAKFMGWALQQAAKETRSARPGMIKEEKPPELELGPDKAEVDEIAASESKLLGVSLRWVVSNFNEAVLERLPRTENSRTSREVDSMNFYELKEYVALNQTGIGYGKRCPRDGEVNCSVVDGLRHEGHSAKATVFMSWVWKYTLEDVRTALQHWAAKETQSQTGHFVWWCFFCNNQYRIQDNGADSDSLAKAFGENLIEIGRMVITLDRLHQPQYVERAWCLFEVWVALQKRINPEIALARDGIAAFHGATARGSFDLDGCLAIESRSATASYTTDKEFIMGKMKGQEDKVNSMVKSALLELIANLVKGLRETAENTRPRDMMLSMLKNLGVGMGIAQLVSQKNLVVVVGNTGSGKSTVINYLRGCKMSFIKDASGKAAIQVAANSTVPAACVIGHTMRSQTSMPTVVDIQDLCFCDCPGFADTRGAAKRVVNAAILHYVMKAAKSLKVVMVLEYGSLIAVRGNGIRELRRLLLSLFGTEEQVIANQSAVLLCISKAPRFDSENGLALTRKHIMAYVCHIAGEDILYSLCQRLVVYHPEDRAHQSWSTRDDLMTAIQGLHAISEPNVRCYLGLCVVDQHALEEIVHTCDEEIRASLLNTEYEEAAVILLAADRLADLLFDPEYVKLHRTLQTSQLTFASMITRQSERLWIRCENAVADDAEAELGQARRALRLKYGYLIDPEEAEVHTLLGRAPQNDDFKPGAHVILVNLLKHRHLNGRFGRIESRDGERNCWKVYVFELKEVKNLRAECLALVDADATKAAIDGGRLSAALVSPPTTPLSSARSSSYQAGGTEFYATWDRSSGDELGVDIKQDDAGGFFLIENVAPGGLADAWNQKHPTLEVTVGDVIIEVNGKRGNSLMADGFCRQREAFKVRIRKAPAVDYEHITLIDLLP